MKTELLIQVMESIENAQILSLQMISFAFSPLLNFLPTSFQMDGVTSKGKSKKQESAGSAATPEQVFVMV
jgi:hypothetical protein